MTTGADILKRIKDENILYLDLRFTDMRGKLQHVTFDQTMVDEDLFEDAKGTKHDWRKELTEVLAKRQKENGSWINAADRWMEGDPNLVTAYSLMALKYCDPK